MMTFKNVRIGGSFVYNEYHYVKLPNIDRERYGLTNAKGGAGYEWLDDKQEVITLCEKCIDTFGPVNSLAATTTMQRESVLLKGKMLSKHVCDEHSAELYDEWEYV